MNFYWAIGWARYLGSQECPFRDTTLENESCKSAAGRGEVFLYPRFKNLGGDYPSIPPEYQTIEAYTILPVEISSKNIIHFNTLTPHLISEHAFFQGHNSDYRLEPRLAVGIMKEFRETFPLLMKRNQSKQIVSKQRKSLEID